MHSKSTIIDICFLSGQPIMRPDDWSREHYAPKSRIPLYIAQMPYNIRPALKSINNIKGNLMPCEWIDERCAICAKALQRYSLPKRWKNQIGLALDEYESARAINPCADCICARLPDICPYKSILDRQR